MIGRHALGVAILATGLVCPLGAQRDFRLDVRGPEPVSTRLGGKISIQIEAQNPDLNAELVDLPKVPNVRAQIYGPSDNQSVYSINGRVTRKKTRTWRIEFEPLEVGEYRVPALEVRAWGKRHKIKAFRFTCVPADASSAFLEAGVVPKAVWVGQEIRLQLRVGVDPEQFRRLLSNTRLDNAYELRIEFPAWDEFPAGGAVDDQLKQVPMNQPIVPINRAYRRAKNLGVVKRGDASFQAFLLEKAVRPSRVGTFRIDRATLRYSWGVRFTQDIWGELRPVEKRDEFARSDNIAVEVKALPTEGQPKGFKGAVGRLEASGKLSKNRVKVGESFSLELQLRGSAISESFEAPDLGKLDGFHTFGKKVDRGSDAIVVRYDLSALTSGKREFPAVEVPFFDPERAAYESATAGPFAIEALAIAGAKGLDALPESKKALTPGLDDLWDRMEVSGRAPTPFEPSPTLAWIALVAPFFLFGFGFIANRAIARSRADVSGKRKRGARAKFDATLATDGPLVALSAYVADRLDWEPGAVLGPELEGRLREAGLSEDRAREAASLFARLEAGRYASGASSESDLARDAGALVDALDRETR